ncbi:MAG: csbd family protein [Bacteroidetes bacterium]|nr:MAG: csbd family protein [Bacteroidota bacterium]
MTEDTTNPTPAPATGKENTINPAPVKGNWNEQKGKLKAKFSTLTDSDLHYENGKKDEMLTKIQNKLGKTKEEFAAIVAAL